MLCYFDNRNFFSTYVKIESDGIPLGYVFLQKNKVICVEIPDESKLIELSFEKTKYEGLDRLNSKSITADEYKHHRSAVSHKNMDVIFDSWKFPYKCCIDRGITNHDLYFLPEELPYPELRGGFYYRGISCETEKPIYMDLKKRIELFECMRNKRNYAIRSSLIRCIFCFLSLLLSLHLFFFSACNPSRALQAVLAVISLGGGAGFIVELLDIISILCYTGMWKEYLLSETYTLE